ncbi:MAG TPA: phage holin family protein [Candidatus Binatia bacterium]
MAGKEDSTEGERSSSFLQSLRAALAAVSSALHTRLELFVTELEEERERLKQALLLTLLLFFCLSFGFILLNIFVVALFWERGWIFAIGALAALYLTVGIAAAVMLRKKILTRPGLFLPLWRS